jgi:1-deoxy-D-xylulose-5-phosphate reductoisomerase
VSARVLTVLGATGTIGVNTLDVVARHPGRFEIFALTGATQSERLFQQCLQHRPKYAVMLAPIAARQLRERLKHAGVATEVLEGEAALTEVAIAPEVDTVMAAIVGAAGLPATLAAAYAGKRILLANKETLVVSGQLFMDAIAASGAELLPIDSEHNAIFQALPRDFNGDLHQAGVKALWLTASGGPFRQLSAEQIAQATPAQAVAHPNWVMGKKISVDSASLMNKGLEVIEARWLFNAQATQIKVMVHPQSIVHSMVEYADGSVIAQMGTPDMRTPIAYALGFPERIEAGVSPLELLGKNLTFEEPDHARFPCLKLALRRPC